MLYALPICILLLFASCIVSIKNTSHLTMMRSRMATLLGMFVIFPIATVLIIALPFNLLQIVLDNDNILNIIIPLSVFLSLGLGGYFLYFHRQSLSSKEYRIMMILSILYFFLLSCFFITWGYVNISLFVGFAFLYIILYQFHLRWAPYFYYSVIALSLFPSFLVFTILSGTSCGLARDSHCTCKEIQVTVMLFHIACIGEVKYRESRGGK